MTKAVAAFLGTEARQARAEERPERLDGSTARSADDRFQLGEAELDRIEVGTVGRRLGARDGAAMRECRPTNWGDGAAIGGMTKKVRPGGAAIRQNATSTRKVRARQSSDVHGHHERAAVQRVRRTLQSSK